MDVAPLLLLPLLLVPPLPREECEFGYEGERTALVDATGASLVRIVAGAGSLRVEGRADLTEVRARGRACASTAALLDAIRLTARRRGGGIDVEVELPISGGFRGDYARLDLTIEVPASLAADIRDSSGHAEISGVAMLEVEDGSGDLTIEHVVGPVHIDDGSGAIRLTDAGGDVRIEDGSGGIEVRDVAGSVTLSDSSGDIEIAEVGGNVVIRRDSSGSIRVAGVRGDFTVEQDDGGRIEHRDVEGVVWVPEAH